MTQTITDAWGRSITPSVSQDGLSIAYHVVGQGQDFTQTFTAQTPQDAAIACIEAAAPAHLDLTAAPAVPQSVTRFQAMAIMSLTPSATNPGKTLLDDATAAVTAAGGLTLLAWQNALTFDRNGQLLQGLAATLGVSSAELDQLFIAAAQIVA